MLNRKLSIFTFFLASFVLLMSGCATVCHNRDIYKPKLVKKGDVSVSIGQTDIDIDIGSYASMDVFECGWADRNDQLDPVALCFTIRVEDKHTFQFSETNIKIIGKSGTEYFVKTGNIKYQVGGKIKEGGVIDSYSSLEPPTTSPIKKKESFKRNRYHASIEFDASAEFKGSWSTYGPAFGLLVNNDLRSREYSSSTKLPPSLRKGFIVELPEVLVDKKKYSMPIIELNYSREGICRSAV